MTRWVQILSLLLASAFAVQAIEIQLNQDDRQRCSGMYSRKSWGGAVEPFILVKYLKDKKSQDEGAAKPITSLLIFEWNDRDLIGKPQGVPADDRHYICTQSEIDAKFCNSTEKWQYILADNQEASSRSVMRTEGIDMRNPIAVNYPVTRTGYYCVATEPFEDSYKYTAIVEFRNAYGELPAAQIAKLPFYGGITVVYGVILGAWGFLYYQNRSDILPVQNYITAILIFLVVEMFMTWGFYQYQNVNGDNVGTKALMIIVSILNAARNSFSFFLLLIVCMGYGVVKPSLGKAMTLVRWLAVAHFVFGVVYAIASLTIKPDEAGPLVLLVILPLSATLTAFYIWTLNSLNLTMKDLRERKQNVKMMMYKKLWWCILTSILVIFGFFFFNSFTFTSTSDPDFPADHWQTRWFVLDGWLNLVYLTDVSFVAYLWRPTANNRRFAMSDELAQDDEGFEIASVNSGRSSLSDLEADAQLHNIPPRPTSNPPAYDPIGGGRGRSVSPLPAPIPQKPVPPPRESLDGDTIFAVGEDKWSDEDSDEDDDDERESEDTERGEGSRLTGR